MATSKTAPKRVRHPWLFALPTLDMPPEITCAGVAYRHVKTYKHDFFAATGLYEGPHGQAVLKMGRCRPVCGLSTTWVGRFLEGREALHYGLVDDLPGAPRFLGRVGPTGLLHEFVPGRPLGRRDEVSDTFFDELFELLHALHARDMAYVDLNKRQNILLGDDGKPYLIDYQISLWLSPVGWRGWRPAQWLLRRFQQADIYHVLKHKRRLRPDLLTEAERRIVERVSVWIRLHRAIARPLTHLRRMLLARLQGRDVDLVAGSRAK